MSYVYRMSRSDPPASTTVTPTDRPPTSAEWSRLEQTSFRYCRQVTQAASSSFPLAFRLLPATKQRAMEALYAFMRLTDDLADGPEQPADKRDQLCRWRKGLTLALHGIPTHPIHRALARTVSRFNIPSQYLTDVIDGVEADLEPVRYQTFEELYPYCYRVASAVGLACIRVWGFRPGVEPGQAEAAAEAAGIAFQLTNILRDLDEDAANGRIYLPLNEWQRFGCSATARSQLAQCPAYQEMMRFQVGRARSYYEKAATLGPLLSKDGRAIYHVMTGTYRLLLDEIERRAFDVFTRRVKAPRWRKLGVFLSAWPIKWGWW